jgi:drug/metabolite transporter (DMT)-like permease
LAAIAQSLYIIGQKLYLTRYNAFQFTTYAIWAGTFFLLIFSPGLIEEVRVAPLDATLALVYLGVFPSAIAYVSLA